MNTLKDKFEERLSALSTIKDKETTFKSAYEEVKCLKLHTSEAVRELFLYETYLHSFAPNEKYIESYFKEKYNIDIKGKKPYWILIQIFGNFDKGNKITAFEKDWDSESDKVWDEEDKE